MPDMSSIGAILNSVKIAAELVKMLKDSDMSLDKAETKLKLAELVSLLADVKFEAAEMQELVLKKEYRIKELEEAQAIKAKMEWRDPVYWTLSEAGQEGPFCPQCYDSKAKVIRLQTYEPEHWRCLTCEKSFYGKNHDSTSAAYVVATEYDPLA